MKLQMLTRKGALMLVTSAALAAATLAPALAADTPCTAKQSDSAAAPANSGAGSTSAADQKAVPDGFGRNVVPGYGTTAPGTPSQLAAEKKKGDQSAQANNAPSDPNCK